MLGAVTKNKSLWAMLHLHRSYKVYGSPNERVARAPGNFLDVLFSLGGLKNRADQINHAGKDEHHAPKQQLTFKDQQEYLF